MMEFQDIMSKHSDKELLEIIYFQEDDYQTEAYRAAQYELESRNLNPNYAEELLSELKITIEAANKRTASQVLKIKRLLHLVVDTFAVFVLFIALSVILPLLFGNTEDFLLFGFPVAYFAYYIFMEFTWQQTIGKMLTSSKVVRIDGEPADIPDLTLRTFCRLIPFDSFTYLFTKNGFHDRVTGTMVIEKEE